MHGIEDASKTCGDRIAISVIYLHLQHMLYKCKNNLYDWKTTFNLLMNGCWTIHTLEMFARYKISTLNFVDEIEVYISGISGKVKKRTRTQCREHAVF